MTLNITLKRCLSHITAHPGPAASDGMFWTGNSDSSMALIKSALKIEAQIAE
jgi:hypothetical protein